MKLSGYQIVKINQRKHPYLGVFSELIKRLFKLRNYLNKRLIN